MGLMVTHAHQSKPTSWPHFSYQLINRLFCITVVEHPLKFERLSLLSSLKYTKNYFCILEEQLHSGPCESRQIFRVHPLLVQFFNKCITIKCLALKMKVKVTESINRNGPIRWHNLYKTHT